jgi:hypothetical protein
MLKGAAERERILTHATPCLPLFQRKHAAMQLWQIDALLPLLKGFIALLSTTAAADLCERQHRSSLRRKRGQEQP